MNTTITILPLYEKPDYAPILALWSYRQWYGSRDIPFDLNLKAYQKRSIGTDVPLSLVAIADTMPVGMVSLKENDLWQRRDLNPWLASLYVCEDYRGKGAGTLLVRALIDEARSSRYNELFLFLGHSEGVDLGAWYESLGWTFVETALDNDGSETSIYRYDLTEKE